MSRFTGIDVFVMSACFLMVGILIGYMISGYQAGTLETKELIGYPLLAAIITACYMVPFFKIHPEILSRIFDKKSEN